MKTPRELASGLKPRAVLAAFVACAALAALVSRASLARADDDPAALFAQGTQALKEGRAGDAIASLEALADRGVVDPVASYDRGLAYATRVRIGAEVPGDLGRAAHGFEEARDLSRDSKLTDDASRALTIVRSEVARRRTRAGQPVEVDPGRSLSRTVASLLAEDTWAVVSVVSSALLALALLVRWLSRASRLRVACGVTAGIAAPALAVSIAMTLAARHDRLGLREAVVVTASARPTDERGIVVAGGIPLPEGARVEIVEARGPWTRVRFGAIEASVPAGALRDLAR
ncbi:MAG TPA: hypothetical protein VGL81_27595 [Polyangiaceae bacterium]|jgi:hypothetical protein